ncbi:uncharacterized protein LOC142319928 [Lycorma delicatula]|uniref:uncharacterized protein LOC142319928 n=1 Tax=Lycorma delicatula TaxID=130591 RepID=UPI003F519994
MNSFKKHPIRKWTWRSPNNVIKTEIHFIITNQKNIIKDVSVLNKFNTGSDHRLVRVRVSIDVKLERQKQLVNKGKTINIESLREKNEEFKMALQERLTQTTEELMTVAEEIGGMTERGKHNSKLSVETRNLLTKKSDEDRK